MYHFSTTISKEFCVGNYLYYLYTSQTRECLREFSMIKFFNKILITVLKNNNFLYFMYSSSPIIFVLSKMSLVMFPYSFQRF